MVYVEMKQLSALGASLAAMAGFAAAEDNANRAGPDADGPASFSFVLENDWFADSDRYYTSGLKVVYSSPEGRGRGLARLVLRADEGDSTRWQISAGQSIFTANNKRTPTPPPDDHPYGGWLYVQGTSIVERQSGAADILSVSAGVVGPASLAEETQALFHDIIDDLDPEGWGSQIRNEPGFIVSYDRIWRAWSTNEDGLGFRLHPHAGVSAGNVLTEARAGAKLRFGSQLDSSLGVARNGPSIPAGGYIGGKDFAWELFAGAQARLVGVNIFLDRNIFREDDIGFGDGVDKETIVGQFELGAAMRIWGVEVAYTHVFQTDEFETQVENQNYGAITISKAF